MHCLCHDNIVALFAITSEIDHYGLVMEHVLHGSLDEFIFIYDVRCSLSTSKASVCVCACIRAGKSILFSFSKT